MQVIDPNRYMLPFNYIQTNYLNHWMVYGLGHRAREVVKTYPQGPKSEKFLHNIQRSLLKSETLLAG